VEEEEVVLELLEVIVVDDLVDVDEDEDVEDDVVLVTVDVAEELLPMLR